MSPRSMCALTLLLAGCKKPPPPTCDDTEDFACFTGVFSGLMGARLEGVKVCTPELEEIDCVTTDADGGWKLPGLPLDTDVLVTARYEDSVDSVFPQHTSMDWYDWYKVMVPQSVMKTNAKRVDLELDEDKGHILFQVWEGLNLDGENTPHVAGVTAELVDGTGTLFYAGGIGLADKNATETGGSGAGGVINLDPGVLTLRFEGPRGPCTEHSFHWKGQGGEIPVPVKAGFTTAIDVICAP